MWLRLLFLLVSTALCSDEFQLPEAALPKEAVYAPLVETPEIKSSLAHLHGAPTAIVAGCVNVINGAYIDQQLDLVIPGIEPLTIQRSYVSSNVDKAFYGDAWHINHEGKINDGIPYPHLTEKIRYFEYFGPFGERILFRGKKHHDNYSLPIAPEVLEKGVTNCSSGTLDARVNIKNTEFTYLHKRRTKIKTPTGAQLFFKRRKGGEYFFLEKAKLFSGSSLEYGREKYYNEKIHNITTYTAAGQYANSIHLEYLNDNTVIFHAHDKRNLIYEYFTISQTGYGDCTLLRRVIKPNGPEENFEYEYDVSQKTYNPRIRLKRLPNERFLNIRYYKLGENSVGYTSENISSADHHSLNRVLSLEAPVGKTSHPIQTHCFFYNPGICRVEDVYRNKTHYKWDENDRLVTHRIRY